MRYATDTDMYNQYTNMLMNQGDYNSAFNAAEATINRDWSQYMSDTQHQRETQDLLAAGLNPVLSANQGAQWTSVGNASSDAAIAQTMLNNQAALRMSEINAEATKAAANATAGATMAAAATSAHATEVAAQKHYDASVDSVPSTVHVGLGPFDFTTSGPNGKVQDLVNSAASIYSDKYYG